MEQIFVFLKYLPYVIFGITFLSFLISLVTAREKCDPKDSFANFGIFACSQIFRALFVGGTMLLLLKTFAARSPFRIPITWWSALLALLVADFCYYWQHRSTHEIRFLWAFHSVHHSSKQYNLTTSLRLPWFGESFNSLFYIPAVLIGFDPVIILLSKVVVLIYQYWTHTEAIGKLGWLDRILITPSNHRVHHGSNSIYLDKNHGGILIIWDRLFGTYEPESIPVCYGLTKPLNSYNPFLINFLEMKSMLSDVLHAQSLKECLGYVFGAPGWEPKRSAMTRTLPASGGSL
jgi:sterol desaturase/sphingolipid hydroxylase (fatty acid hydroxylase superfamily)